MTELTVRPATLEDADTVAEVVADAFVHDPSVVAMLGRGRDVHSVLAALVRLQIASLFLPHGAVDVAEHDGRVVGAGLWLAPDAPGLLAEARQLPAYLRLLRTRLPAAIIQEVNSARCRPRFRHWYLNMLAVSPDQQGNGVGAALLDRRLAEIGDDQPSYLEASSDGSARLYARHGFVQLGPVPLVNRRLLQGMWRPAARTMKQ